MLTDMLTVSLIPHACSKAVTPDQTAYLGASDFNMQLGFPLFEKIHHDLARSAAGLERDFMVKQKLNCTDLLQRSCSQLKNAAT